jgi:hypothetical protein
MTRAARRARDRRLSAASRARHRARGHTALFAFLPRTLAQAIAAAATRLQTTRAIVVEAALAEALPHVRPSTVQRVQMQRRQAAESLSRTTS